jgi:hypothetical protein
MAPNDHKAIAGHHYGYYSLLHRRYGPCSRRKKGPRRTNFSTMETELKHVLIYVNLNTTLDTIVFDMLFHLVSTLLPRITRCEKKYIMLFQKYTFYRSRYSDWLRNGRLRGRSSSPGTVKNFLHVVQTSSEVHPTSYPMGTRGTQCEADQSFPTSAEVNKI